MQKWLLIFVACVVLVISLLVHLPAQLVVPESSSEVQLVGISGTLWRGTVSEIRVRGKILPVRNLSWSVRPLALLKGSLEAEFQEQFTPANHGSVGLGLFSREIVLREVRWQASSKSFGAAVFLQGVKARGDLTLDIETVRFPAGTSFPSQVAAQLDWQNAKLQFGSEHWRIGSPQIQLSGADGAIDGVFTNAQPFLPGDGTFQCTAGGCDVELNLRPSPGAPQSMLNGMLLAGLRQTADGFSGRIDIPLK